MKRLQMTHEPETMVAVISFAGDNLSVRAGMEFPSDHPVVRRCPGNFVKAGNEELVAARRAELYHTDLARQKEHEAEQREARLAEGSKASPGDAADVEAYKKIVRESDGFLELRHDPKTGLVIGVDRTARLRALQDAAVKAGRVIVIGSGSTPRLAGLGGGE